MSRPATLPQHSTDETVTPNVAEPPSPPSFHPTNDAWKLEMQWMGQTINLLTRRHPASNLTSLVPPSTLERIDYPPFSVPPTAPSPLTPTIPCPWSLTEAEIASLPPNHPTARLDLEISRFAAWARPTRRELAARHAVWTSTRAYISRVLAPLRLPGQQPIHVSPFGSQSTGLASATSDIDLRLHEHGSATTDYSAFGAPLLRELFHRMQASRTYIAVTARLDGTYPILNATHAASGLPIQIVCAPPTDRQNKCVRHYLATVPHLREVYAVLRTAFAMRGLLDVFHGGTGSYGLLVFLVAALTRRATPSSVPPTPGMQLRRFVEFYSSFDTTRFGIALRPTTHLFRKHTDAEVPADKRKALIRAALARKVDTRRGDAAPSYRAGRWAIGRVRPLQPYLLCVQDPADGWNDLGRKGNAVKLWRETVKGWRLEDGEGLEEVVGRCWEVFAGARGKVEDFGRVVQRRLKAGEGRERKGGIGERKEMGKGKEGNKEVTEEG
ncbi:hypothetical protein M433DRAFT_147768 [Acidomyces richmondensis BFW]|nr:MAG: hypothetical protein FE78DRAFT_77186 [Acidomyces sp. 'richmondensis']KYG41318.1 hypothetical protein M433DRAFT_147768 [Acidomyces richmondensis BFW]